MVDMTGAGVATGACQPSLGHKTPRGTKINQPIVKSGSSNVPGMDDKNDSYSGRAWLLTLSSTISGVGGSIASPPD